MRVFLDANIPLSGAQEGGPIREMLDLLAERSELVTHPYSMEEAERNLVRKCPDWMAGYRSLLKQDRVSESVAGPLSVELDAKDRPVLGAAVAARCSHLLTGDFLHFRHLMGREHAGVTIVSARMLAEEMFRRGWIST